MYNLVGDGMKDKLLTEIKFFEKEKEKYISELVLKLKKYSKVILYGTSEGTINVIKLLNENDVKIDSIYDDDDKKKNTIFFGYKVTKPNIECNDKDIAIVVTISFYDNIRDRFIKYDKDIDKRLFMCDGYFYEDIDEEYFYKNLDKIVDCYESLEDDLSKKLYIALLKYRFIRDGKLINELREHRDKCYFDKVFMDKFQDGLFIDAGSYNADFITTLAKFKNLNNSRFYIFEPNKNFVEQIRNNLKDQFNYKVFEVALCDVKSKMEFQQTKTSTSHLVDSKYNAYKNMLENTVDLVDTDTLDNIAKNDKVFCIKIDIEGSEQSMIRGATKTIKRDKPIMLISIYHKCSDLWEIEYYIKNLNLNYKFYIRHYSYSVAKTILYCIPQ